jgi:biopolymer transport protein ExbD
MRLGVTTDTEDEGEVQMAPLIDCVFILLIFFLVTSMLQKPHKDLGIVLPDAANAEEATAQYDTIVFEVTAPRPPYGDPVVAMDGEEMTQTLLHKRLRMMVLKDPDRRVRVDADREARVEDVSKLLDLLQFEGLNNVGVRTKD